MLKGNNLWLVLGAVGLGLVFLTRKATATGAAARTTGGLNLSGLNGNTLKSIGSSLSNLFGGGSSSSSAAPTEIPWDSGGKFFGPDIDRDTGYTTTINSSGTYIEDSDIPAFPF